MDPLTSSIVNTASALNSQRLQSEMSVRLLDKALDQQGQMAMALLQSVASPSASPAGTGELIDVIA
jgi:hypothetical protein